MPSPSVHSKKCPLPLLQTFAKEVVLKYYPEYNESYTLEPFVNETNFGLGGFGSSSICFIRDAKGSLLAVIKGCRSYHNLEATYIDRLIPACDLLRQLPLQFSKLILPFTTALYTVDTKQYQTIAIAPAPGRCMIDYLVHISKARPFTKKRQIALQQFLQAVEKNATALAELHALSPHKNRPIAPRITQIEDSLINYFLALLEKYPQRFPFSIDIFKKRFATLFQAAHAIPFSSGYIHGDSNISNIFYDPTTQQISFIDSLTLFHSIDNQGCPCGNIAQDYAFCRYSFNLYAEFYQLSSLEKQTIDETFAQSYQRQNPYFEIPMAHIYFYCVYHWIAYAKIIDHLMYSRPQMTSQLSPLFAYVLQKLNTLLQFRACLQLKQAFGLT